MRVSSITKNAGKACNNRLYRHIRTFEKIVKNYFVIFIKNIEAAVKFHAKFAESNNLLLANSIANKIEDGKLRENTLSEISKNIILSKNTME